MLADGPGFSEPDGRRRFPARVNHTAVGAFAALVPADCARNETDRVGCVGLLRPALPKPPLAAHLGHADCDAEGAAGCVRPPRSTALGWSALQQAAPLQFAADGAFPGGSADTYAVALGDVSGDGLLDVLVGNYGEANELWVQQPGGGWAADGVPAAARTRWRWRWAT